MSCQAQLEQGELLERTKPGCYVLLGGEKYPVQSTTWIEQSVIVHFAPKYTSFRRIDTQWCAEVLSGELYKNINRRKFNKIQNNEMGKVIVLDMKSPIELDLVRIL